LFPNIDDYPPKNSASDQEDCNSVVSVFFL